MAVDRSGAGMVLGEVEHSVQQGDRGLLEFLGRLILLRCAGVQHRAQVKAQVGCDQFGAAA